MENRKGQGYGRYLGTREVVGRIEINDRNEVFKIISNRSGVVNNEVFDQLTRENSPYGYYYKTFRRLERLVAEGIKWDSTTEDEKKLEKQILSDPTWDESKERYVEDSLTRNTRVIEVVRNIIDARRDEIVSLEINEDFVSELIEEHTQKIQHDLDDIAERLTSKNLSPGDISNFLEKINFSRSELRAFSDIVSPYHNVSTLRAFESDLESRYDELLSEKKVLETRLKEEEDARLQAETFAKETEEKLALEVEKNTYLLSTRRTLSSDADGLIHNVKISSYDIVNAVDNLINLIQEDTLTSQELLRRLGSIKIYANKTLLISEIATRSNFREDFEKQSVDVVKYMVQYIEVHKQVFSNERLEFEINTNNASLTKRISILNLAIILDNLLSNSVKWMATKVRIDFHNPNEKSLQIVFSDDGLGLSEKFLQNPELLFQLGMGATSPNKGGSGIGMYFVRDLLKKMYGEIKFLGNNTVLKGASFQIDLIQPR
jgi:signal transduction histidine kinase